MTWTTLAIFGAGTLCGFAAAIIVAAIILYSDPPGPKF